MSYSSLPLGTTRSRIARNYALITPDTHVWSTLPGATDCQLAVHISPHMGARFVQATVKLKKYGAMMPPLESCQRFIYVNSGQVDLTFDGTTRTLDANSYAYLPPNCSHEIVGKTEESTLTLFEKKYQAILGMDPPMAIVGDSKSVESSPFMGDEDAQLKLLLPNVPQFDMAVNIFNYQPGTNLPQVEIHVMEHGLVMLDGAGVYRLGDDWFPVQKDDVIWMASYCPQWFVAMGKKPASYLYYKDVNRNSIEL